MKSIAQIYQAVKNGEALENLIPVGASLAHWRGLLNSYDPTAKPRKPSTRKVSGKTTRKIQKAAMENVTALATLTLVERVNGKKLNAWGRATAEIPFDGSGPGDDDEGTEASLGLPSPF